MSSLVEIKTQVKLYETLISESDDSDLKETWTERVKDLKIKLAEATLHGDESPDPKLNPNKLIDYKKVQLRTIQVASIPIFNGTSPDEVGLFLTRLKQLQVSCALDDSEVIQHAKGKLSPSAYRSLEQYIRIEGDIDTLNTFNRFIKKIWGAQLSTFQLLESCCSLSRNQNESWLV